MKFFASCSAYDHDESHIPQETELISLGPGPKPFSCRQQIAQAQRPRVGKTQSTVLRGVLKCGSADSKGLWKNIVVCLKKNDTLINRHWTPFFPSSDFVHFNMIRHQCASLNGPEWYFITILDNVTQVCVSAPLGWSFWKKNWSSARWQQHQHSSISSSMSTAKVNHKREETQTKGPKRGNSSFSVFSAQATIRPAAAAWTSWDSYHHPKTCHHDFEHSCHTGGFSFKYICE